MEFSAKVQRDWQRLNRQRAGFERRVDRELDKHVERYRTRFAELRRSGERPLSIIAEGDSWFRYGIGFAVIYHLENLLDVEIQNLAKPGDEARKMLTGKQAKRLKRELDRGPSLRQKYQFLLFSGGGNDLVGEDTFYKWLNDYEDGMTAAEVINSTTLNAALRTLEVNYKTLIAIRDAASPETHLLLHGYDLAYPDGRPACWFGPWMEPGLDFHNVPPKPMSFRKEVVEHFLRRFDAMLRRVSRHPKKNVHVVPTQGTLTSHAEWENELHPSKGGFEKIAQQFQAVITDIEG